MIDLKNTSGLPIEVNDDFTLNLKHSLVSITPDIRRFEDMKSVLFDPDAKPVRDEMYFMYRDVHLADDEKKIHDDNLRYDITVIPPAMLGDEYTKTLGHYHNNVEGSPIAYPELYEVLSGQAIFLLQKMDHAFEKLVTILAIEAQAGDKIIYPPNYGHIIVNIGKDVLVTANWVSTSEVSSYEQIKEKHGMALYVVKGDDGQPTFVKNKNYKDHPLMRKLNHEDKIRQHFGLDKAEPMYVTAMKNPQVLDFLNNPQKYALEFSSLSS